MTDDRVPPERVNKPPKLDDALVYYQQCLQVFFRIRIWPTTRPRSEPSPILSQNHRRSGENVFPIVHRLDSLGHGELQEVIGGLACGIWGHILSDSRWFYCQIQIGSSSSTVKSTLVLARQLSNSG